MLLIFRYEVLRYFPIESQLVLLGADYAIKSARSVTAFSRMDYFLTENEAQVLSLLSNCNSESKRKPYTGIPDSSKLCTWRYYKIEIT